MGAHGLSVARLYAILLRTYGPQGWWPLSSCTGCNPTSSGALQGYHPGDYSYPHDEAERFEICVGAILTQNTAWPNVERAIRGLQQSDLLSAEALLAVPDPEIAAAIRSAGYFNVKARKLRTYARFFLGLRGRTPSRDGLLGVWGIGPETADSMLLYAYGQPEMVVDAYTRRILSHLALAPGGEMAYDAVKAYCQDPLPRDPVVYQEFHALIVEHAKRHYRRRPYEDPILGPVVQSLSRRGG